MPIIDQQRRLAEKGRIRLGEKKTTASGTSYPAKLDRLRFTSPDKAAIERLAVLYGGDVEQWEGQWQVVAGTREIAVMLVPAAMGFSQWYEDWTGAVCRKRCDGVTDHVRDIACDCDPDNRKCKTTTRLSVILPELPGLGVWRLETHGYYASVEIAAAVEMVELAAGAGAMLPARLRLEDRTVKRLIDNKVETRNFVVPVIDLDVSAHQLASISNGGRTPPVAFGAGGGAPLPGVGQGGLPPSLPTGETPVGTPPPPAPSWKPVDQAALPAAPFVSVKDQMAEVHRERKPRKNAAAPIKPTGMKPRAANEAVCHLCGEPYGDGGLKKNPSNEGNRFVHTTCAARMDQPAAKAEEPSRSSEGAGDRQDTGVGDRDGTSGGSVTAEPVPAAPPIRDLPMSANQHGMVMKLCAQAFPVDPKKLSGAQADEYRRDASIKLARQLGWEITSRSDLTKRSASVMIDALKGIVEGTYRWVDDELIEASSGDRIMVVSS